MLLEVDVVPHQPQRLSLPQPQGQRDRPPRTVGQLGGSEQQPAALLQRIRLELGLANTGDDRVGAGVGDQQSRLTAVFIAERKIRCSATALCGNRSATR